MANVGEGISPPLDSPLAEELRGESPCRRLYDTHVSAVVEARAPLTSPAARPVSLLSPLSSPTPLVDFGSRRAGVTAGTGRRRSTSRLLVSPQRTPPPASQGPERSRVVSDMPIEQPRIEGEGEAQGERCQGSSVAWATRPLSPREDRRVTSPSSFRLIYENGSDAETIRRLSSRNRSLTVTPPLVNQTDRDSREDEEGQLRTSDAVRSRPPSAFGRKTPECFLFSLPRDDPSSSSSSSVSVLPAVPQQVGGLSEGSSRRCTPSRRAVPSIIGPSVGWASSGEEETSKGHSSVGEMRRSGGVSVFLPSPSRQLLQDTSEIMRSFHALQLHKESEVLMEYETKGRSDVINSYLCEARELLIEHTFRLAMLRKSSASAPDASRKPKSISPRMTASPIPFASVKTEKMTGGSKGHSPVPKTSTSETWFATRQDSSSPMPRAQVTAAGKPSAREPNASPCVAEGSLQRIFADELAERQSIGDAAADAIHFLLRYRRLVETALNPSALLLWEANQRQGILMDAAVSARYIQGTQRNTLLQRAHRLAALAEDEDNERFSKYVPEEARERRRLKQLFVEARAAIQEMELHELSQRTRRAVEAFLQEERMTREDIVVEELRNREGIYRSGEASASMRMMGDTGFTGDPHTSAMSSPEYTQKGSKTPTATTETVSMAQTLPMAMLAMEDMSPSETAQIHQTVVNKTTNASNGGSTVAEQVFIEWNPTSNTVTRATATTMGTPTVSTGVTVLLTSSHELSADHSSAHLFGTQSPTPQHVDSSTGSTPLKRDAQSCTEGKAEKEAYNRGDKPRQGKQQASINMAVTNDGVDDVFTRGDIRDPIHNSSGCDLMDRDTANRTDDKKSMRTQKKKTSTHGKSPIDWQRPLNRHIVPCSLECKGTSPAKNATKTTGAGMRSHYDTALERTPPVQRLYREDIIFEGSPPRSQRTESVEGCPQGEVGNDIGDDLSGPSSSSGASSVDSPSYVPHKYHLRFDEFKDDHEEEAMDLESVEEVESVQDIWVRTDHSHDRSCEIGDDSPGETGGTPMDKATQIKCGHDTRSEDDKDEQDRHDLRDVLNPRNPTDPELTLPYMHETTMNVSDDTRAYCDTNYKQTRANSDTDSCVHRCAKGISVTSGRSPFNYMRSTMSWRRQHEKLEWLPSRSSHKRSCGPTMRSVSRTSRGAQPCVSRMPFEEGPGVWPELSEPRRPFDFDPPGERAYRAVSNSPHMDIYGEGVHEEGHGAVCESVCAEAHGVAAVVQSPRRARDAARRFMAEGSVSPARISACKAHTGKEYAEGLSAALRGVVAHRSALLSSPQRPPRSGSETPRRAATPSYVDAFFRLTPGEAGRKGFLAALRGDSAIRDATPLRTHAPLSGRSSRGKTRSSAGVPSCEQRLDEKAGDSKFIAQTTGFLWTPQSKHWR